MASTFTFKTTALEESSTPHFLPIQGSTTLGTMQQEGLVRLPRLDPHTALIPAAMDTYFRKTRANDRTR